MGARSGPPTAADRSGGGSGVAGERCQALPLLALYFGYTPDQVDDLTLPDFRALVAFAGELWTHDQRFVTDVPS